MTVIPTGYCEAQLAIENDFNSHVSSISMGFASSPEIEVLGNLHLVLEAALPDLAQDMLSEFRFTSARYTFSDGAGGTGSVDVPFSSAIDGGVSGDCMDVRSAYVINKNTSELGRAQRGRFYLPGVNENYCGPLGDLNPTFRGDMNNHLSTFLDGLLNPASPLTEQQPYLLHSDDALDPTPISNLSPARLVGRIRRRG